jgi:membrane associated rhomboid family serine protease
LIPLKDDSPRARPIVTRLLIGACALAFSWQLSLDPVALQRAVDALGAIPAVLSGQARLPGDLQWVPRFTALFTSMFLHIGWGHLLGNLLYLWVYGGKVETGMGPWRFFCFYLVCGGFAVFAQALSDPASPYPIIGASGAISGVLGAYLMLYPRAKVLTLVLLPFFFTTVQIPARWLLLLWFAAQLLSDFAKQGRGTGVAFGAHIGGFLIGAALVIVFKRREVPLFAR